MNGNSHTSDPCGTPHLLRVSGSTYVTRCLEQQTSSWKRLIKEITSTQLGLGPNQAGGGLRGSAVQGKSTANAPIWLHEKLHVPICSSCCTAAFQSFAPNIEICSPIPEAHLSHCLCFLSGKGWCLLKNCALGLTRES